MKLYGRITGFLLFLWCLLSMFQNSALGCDTCIIAGYSKEGVSTISAATLEKQRMSLGLTFEYQKWNELDHREAHELHEAGRDIHNFSHDEFYHFSLGYGFTDDFELNVKMPFVRKSFLRVEDGVVGQGDSSSGMGDLILLGKNRFYKGEVDIAAIGGIKFPTGETVAMGFDGKKLEPEEQPGTGSFDYLFGVALVKQFNRFLLGADFIYNLKTKGAQEREFGDVIRVDISSSYALRKLGIFPNMRLTGEVNSQFLQRDHDRTGEIFDSGGHIVFLAPGIAIDATKNSTFFVSAPIPVIQDRGGEHPEVDYEIISGAIFHW